MSPKTTVGSTVGWQVSYARGLLHKTVVDTITVSRRDRKKREKAQPDNDNMRMIELLAWNSIRRTQN
jgi:hypothetical protein